FSTSPISLFFFFFNHTATTELYTLSLHDALPISAARAGRDPGAIEITARLLVNIDPPGPAADTAVRRHVTVYLNVPVYRAFHERSEEHTSELQSRGHLVCRLLLEKKKKN